MKTNRKDFWKETVMPIGGYYGPIASYTDEQNGYTSHNFLEDAYFKMIADCGLNLITSVDCDFEQNPQDIIKMLELCDKYQIQMFVKDSGLKAEMSTEGMGKRIEAYSGYQSFAGVCVIDEPSVDYYPKTFDGEQLLCNNPLRRYQDVAIKINGFDGILGYVNLFPFYFWMGNTLEEYRDYVKEYCDTCHPKVISYDHYPFDYEDRERAYKIYFTNLSVIRAAAKQLGIPYWAFVQCGGQWNDAMKRFESKPYFPLEGEFTWNVNTCLAMGAKGIQYFPLVQPHYFALSPDGIDPKRNGLIGADGSTTQWYGYAKKMNRQIVAVDEVLMQAEHVGVLAIGKAVLHTHDVACVIKENQFRELIGIKTQEAGALIGCYEYVGKSAFYIVNYDMYGAQEIVLKFDEVYKLSQVTGNETKVQETDSLAVELQAGEAILIVVNEGGKTHV